MKKSWNEWEKILKQLTKSKILILRKPLGKWIVQQEEAAQDWRFWMQPMTNDLYLWNDHFKCPLQIEKDKTTRTPHTYIGEMVKPQDPNRASGEVILDWKIWKRADLRENGLLNNKRIYLTGNHVFETEVLRQEIINIRGNNITRQLRITRTHELY